MKTTLLALIFGIILSAGPAFAASGPDGTPGPTSAVVEEAAMYTIDPAHTTVGFRIRHMGIAFVEGEFDEFAGTITFDPNNLSATRADVTVKTTSIDTDVERRDNHLRSADFFDVESYPEMTFTSTSVQPTGPTSFRLLGNLTMKGNTKPVAFDVEAAGPITTDQGARIGFHATTEIDRRDFGITWGSDMPSGVPSVGNTVQLVLDVEAVAGS